MVVEAPVRAVETKAVAVEKIEWDEDLAYRPTDTFGALKVKLDKANAIIADMRKKLAGVGVD